MARGIRLALLVAAVLVAAATLASCVRPLSWTWGARDRPDSRTGRIVVQDGHVAVGMFDPSGTQDQTPRLDDLLYVSCLGARLLIQEVGPSEGLAENGTVCRLPAAITYEIIVPGWLAVVALGAYPGVATAIQRVRAARRVRLGRCVHCGYDLRGSAGEVCPECGRPLAPHRPSRAS